MKKIMKTKTITSTIMVEGEYKLSLFVINGLKINTSGFIFTIKKM